MPRLYKSWLLILFLIPLALHAQEPEEFESYEAETPADVPTDIPLTEEEKTTVLDTLELRDMDINDVLKLLAAKSGLNIIAGKGVQGRVSIFLQNVEIHDALTIILKANDLAYIEDRGIVQIVSSAEYEQTMGKKFGVVTESTIVPLQSIKAPYAVTLLAQVKSPSGKLIADEQSNTVIIEDVPQKVKTIVDFLKTIDVPTQMKVHKLQFVPAEALAAKLQDMVSPKIGSAKFDVASNKIFLNDTPKKLLELEAFIKQVDIPRETQVFEISYAKAEDIAKTVSTMLTKDIGNAQFDGRTNSLIVTDIAPKIDEISRIVLAMDRQQKQVLIEARIVEINLTDAYKMGINWETLIPDAQHTKVRLKNDFGLSNTVNPQSITTIGTLDKDDYSVVLNMIANLGNTKTLSNPQIAVVNNQEAKILVGSSVPYITTTTTTPSSGPATTAEAVTLVDVGIKLVVTPTVHDDNYITMKIKPEVSSADKTITTGEGNTIPIKQTSEVDTTIRVKDGITIMIGGLIKDIAVNKKNKIPVLGDVPLLGKAFRNEERSTEKTEIVIFLTPKIITGDVVSNVDQQTSKGIKSNKTYYNPLPKDLNINPL